MSIVGFTKGNYKALIAGVDQNGLICGYSPEVKNYDNIYYMQTTDASNNVRLKGVCVTTCPAEANTKFGTDECYEEKENQC